MGKLLKKEFRLVMHPVTPFMLLLSAMVMIPNYPYAVIFFYTTMALFFTCLLGRENNDVVYTLSLPVAKKDVVKARLTFSVIIETIQMVMIIPFAVLKKVLNMPANQAGIDAGFSLFAWGFILYGVFNVLFFTKYYANVRKVGISFVITSFVIFICIFFEITATYAIPFVRDHLDTSDAASVWYRVGFLVAGIAVYTLLTVVTFRLSEKAFEKQDIN